MVRVILPTHNRSAVLGDALQSALGQSYRDLEVVVVDDGSSDGTADLVADWARRDPRIRYLRQAQSGAAAARNAGMALAGTPPILAFLDSDDIWEADHLANSVAVLNGNPDVGLVFARYETVDHIGKMTPQGAENRARRMDNARSLGEITLPGGAVRLSADRSLSAMLLSEISPLTSTVVLRTPPQHLRYFDPTQDVLEDILYFIRLAANGTNFAYFDPVHVRVRYFGDNLTARLGLDSPVALRRLHSNSTFQLKKLTFARRPVERNAVRVQVADAAYLLGQCAAEQNELQQARAAYLLALSHRFDWHSAKGLLGASLPPRVRGLTRRLLGRAKASEART